ncbi:hypothetical protein QQ045_012757 [Rhodiola kirilowii]
MSSRATRSQRQIWSAIIPRNVLLFTSRGQHIGSNLWHVERSKDGKLMGRSRGSSLGTVE